MNIELTSMRITQRILRSVAVFCMLFPPLCSDAQTVFPDQNGSALAGVDAFYATVQIRLWTDMPGDREAFRRGVQSAFELGLRRDGVVVDETAPNYLICKLLFRLEISLVTYSYEVNYYSFEAEGVHNLLWNVDGLGTVGLDNLRAQDFATTCTDAFANEWLRWNPSRR